MAQTHADEPLNQRVTSGDADLDGLRLKLTSWLAGRDGVEGPVGVSEVSKPESSGMSNTSVLFDATWTPAGAAAPQTVSLVARLSPRTTRSLCSRSTTCAGSST